MKQSSVESPVHHQQELADPTLSTAIDNSSNKDLSSSIPSPFTSSLNINAIVQEKVEFHEVSLLFFTFFVMKNNFYLRFTSLFIPYFCLLARVFLWDGFGSCMSDNTLLS